MKERGIPVSRDISDTISIVVDWNTPVFFCGSRQAAIAFTESFLRRCHRRLKS